MTSPPNPVFHISIDKDPNYPVWAVSINKTCVGGVIELGPGKYTTLRLESTFTTDPDKEYPDPILALYALVGPEVAETIHYNLPLFEPGSLSSNLLACTPEPPKDLFDKMMRQIEQRKKDKTS